ncbi:hypothetical protein [Kitasatospora sp. McL0602]|uniref:hypothetical protein n=1 Tax=Kitasatospora sp. McL0602 TaxID=3439530 RepID=UPI003F8A944B
MTTTDHQPQIPTPAEADPSYFPYAATTAVIAIAEARSALAGPLGSTAGDARDLHQHIANQDLVIYARTFDDEGHQRAIGVYRPTGQHFLLSGSGADRYVQAEFASAAKARQYFRAEVLRETPVPTVQRADLLEFSRTLTAHLPGWTGRTHDITLGEHHAELHQEVWDLGIMDDAFEQFVLHEAAVLTGPNGARAVVVHRPDHRDRFLVGALQPTGIPVQLLGPPAPMAISVSRDPVRAAAEVRQRFLPRFEQATLTSRVRILESATEGINEALASWDAVSDSLCDEDGWPLDQVAYEDRLVARDAAAWEHAEVFLLHAPSVVDAARENLRAADPSGALHPNLWRNVRETEKALAQAAELGRECEQSEALAEPPGVPRTLYVERARELRNSEGWHYTLELATHAGGLGYAAEAIRPAPAAEHSPQNQAALARSAPSTAAALVPGLPATRVAAAPSPRHSR